MTQAQGQSVTNVKVRAYVRVSTQLQADHETPENQKKAIREYASANGLEIVQWYEDVESGASLTRKEFNAMLSSLGDVAGIVVYDVDRLFREEEAGLALMFKLMRDDKKVWSVRGGEADFNDPTDRLVHMVKTWASAEERRKIKERQKQGIARYISNHGRWGPKLKKVNWKAYDKYKEAKLSNAAIARIMGMSPRTMKRRLAERRKEQC